MRATYSVGMCFRFQHDQKFIEMSMLLKHTSIKILTTQCTHIYKVYIAVVSYPCVYKIYVSQKSKLVNIVSPFSCIYILCAFYCTFLRQAL